MPLFRNVDLFSASGRRSSLRSSLKHDPITYDEQGWQNLPAHAHYPTPSPSDVTSPSSMSAHLDDTAAYPSQTSINKRIARRGKKADRIPRPRNSFICFRSEFYKMKKRNSGGHDQNEISKEAGRVWKLLTRAEKQTFEDMATREKAEHRLRYPTYSYSPSGREKKAAVSKRKASTIKKASSPKKVTLIRQGSIESENPIILPSLPKFSPSLEDFRLAFPTLSPQPEYPPSEEMLDLTGSDNEHPVEFHDTNWSSISRSSKSSVRTPSPDTLDDKSKVYDLSVRHPSYDIIPEAFGVRPSLVSEEFALDKFLPNMPTPQDVLLFACNTHHNPAFLTSPQTSIHDDWDPIAISMSSQEGGYDYVDFGLLYGLDVLDDGHDSMDIFSENEVVERTTSSPALEETYAGMSEYFDFNYRD